MNKLNKYILFILLISPFIIIFLFYLYFFINDKISHNFYIEEKLIVQFYSDKNIDTEKNYILDLNTWKYEEYNWEYLRYPCDEINQEYNYIDNIYYNKEKTAFIFCRESNQNYINKIIDNKILAIKSYTNFSKWYWSQDWKYLIIIEKYSWLKKDVNTIWIIDINIWKIRNLFYWNIRDRVFIDNYLEIKEILWYVIE